MQIKIEQLVQGGDGFGHLENNKAVFVSQALPEEVVSIKITKETKSHCKAEIDNIIKASPFRVEPLCPHYGICGGCNLQHLEREKQVEAKTNIVLNHLEHIGGINLDDVEIEKSESGKPFNYRNRVRFHVDLHSKTIGFLKSNSKDLIPIEHCPILVDSLNEELKTKDNLIKAARKKIFTNRGKGKYIEVSVFAGDNDISFGNEVVDIQVLNHTFKVSSSVFFQSNKELLEKLITYVKSQIDSDSVMDLYSGVGTFSAFLPANTIAVEKQKECLVLSKINAPNSIAYTGEVEAWGKKAQQSVDTIVVDPPRTGLFETVPSLLNKFNAKKIIYVSCNPVTLARDIKSFDQLGYKLKKCKVFDFYPQTHHVESVVVLEKN